MFGWGNGGSDAEFCFEEWAVLAKSDPHAFELRRKKVIDNFLNKSSEGKRKLGVMLQREIDSVRHHAPNPHVAFQSIAKMLCQQVSFLSEELNSLGDDMRLVQASWR